MNVTSVLPDGTIQVTHLNETSINYVVTDLRRDTDYIHYYINWFQFLSSGLVPGMLRNFFCGWIYNKCKIATRNIGSRLNWPASLSTDQNFECNNITQPWLRFVMSIIGHTLVNPVGLLIFLNGSIYAKIVETTRLREKCRVQLTNKAKTCHKCDLFTKS